MKVSKEGQFKGCKTISSISFTGPFVVVFICIGWGTYNTYTIKTIPEILDKITMLNLHASLPWIRRVPNQGFTDSSREQFPK